MTAGQALPIWSLCPMAFGDVPGWPEDDHGAALSAFARHCEKPTWESYRTGALGIAPDNLLDLAAQAGRATARDNPRTFFETRFTPVRLQADDRQRGLVTGFYEPIVDASRKPVAPFLTPIHRRPSDLVAVDPGRPPAGVPTGYRFGRQSPAGAVTVYPDRAAIMAGALDGLGLEIAFVADPADAFFIHVQGAARLRLADGETIGVTYDGKSGHPFTAVGRLLAERGEIDPNAISMAAIRQWLADHPQRASALMAENRSYIFFKEYPVNGSDDGPVAAAKIPLTAGRSLAVDRLVHTFATPVFVNVDRVNGQPWRRLMIAQETGTAIAGPARGDIFFGSGDQAGQLAGAVRSPCDFTVLVPNERAGQLPQRFQA